MRLNTRSMGLKASSTSIKTGRDSGFGLVGVLVIVLVIGLVGVVGWKGWEYLNKPKTTASQTNMNKQANTTITNTKTTKPNVFKIPELGVEFDEVGGVVPVYYGSVINNGNTGHLTYFYTQEIIDQGKRESKDGVRNDCAGAGSPLYIYDSLDQANSVASALGMTADAAHGYFTINGKIFQVPTTQPDEFPPICTTTPEGNQTEHQQWQYLHDSLMTIRSIK